MTRSGPNDFKNWSVVLFERLSGFYCFCLDHQALQTEFSGFEPKSRASFQGGARGPHSETFPYHSAVKKVITKIQNKVRKKRGSKKPTRQIPVKTVIRKASKMEKKGSTCVKKYLSAAKIKLRGGA